MQLRVWFLDVTVIIIFSVIQATPIPRWPSGMFKAIGTGGRWSEPWPGLAVPQKLLLEWPISV